jgi:hypothetical protein
MTSSHTPGAGASLPGMGNGPGGSWSTDWIDAESGLATEPVARFRFDAVDGTWWWSPEMYALHGFSPGEVVPTTALLMSHKHADDRARTESLHRAVLHTGEPFCCRHRIIDASGAVRLVLTLAEGTCDENGTVVSVQGYFIDVTDSFRRAVELEAHAAVTRAAETRAAIEQAKGVLIGVYRVDPDTAFDLLRWRSQQTNTKIRVLADGLVRHVTESPDEDDLTPTRRLSAYLGLPETTGRLPELTGRLTGPLDDHAEPTKDSARQV